MHRSLWGIVPMVLLGAAVAGCGIELSGGVVAGSDAGRDSGGDGGPRTDGSTGRPTLTVKMTAPAAQVELDQEGTLGWIHWGAAEDPKAFDEKVSAQNAIPSFEATGVKELRTLQDNFTTFRWTNGTPNETDTANRTAVYALGASPSFILLQKVARTSLHLVIYAGVYRARGRMRATLVAPDGTSVTADATLENNDKNGYGRFDVNAGAVALGAKLDVRWELAAGVDDNSNITLAAATLAP